MTARRVYVLWTHSLFYESVRLLLAHPDILLAGATADLATAREQIAQAQPDIIVIEDQQGGFAPGALEILGNCPLNTRVIGLNLSDNVLKLYHLEQRTAERADDLLRLVLT